MKRKRIAYGLVAGVAIAALSVGIYTLASPTWNVPQTLHYEGVLVDASGAPISDAREIVFRIWDDETSKDASHMLWDEPLNVNFKPGGVFSETLGATAGNALPGDLFAGGRSLWLGIAIGFQADAANELSPRYLLHSVPYALKAGESTHIAAETVLDDGILAGSRAADKIADLEARIAAIESGASVVNATGDTMTGALGLPTNGLTVGTDQLVCSGGNVGIGTSSPGVKLDVNGPTSIGTPLKMSPSIYTTTLYSKISMRYIDYYVPAGVSPDVLQPTMWSGFLFANLAVLTANPTNDRYFYTGAWNKSTSASLNNNFHLKWRWS